jgi:hypothetical protein
MIDKIKRTRAKICSLLKRSEIPMRSVPSLSRIIRGRLIYILPPYLHLVHYLYVFFVKNVLSKHFDLGIQAIGSLNGCPNFGWRSHFWMDIAGFLDVRPKNRISMIKRSAPATPGGPPDIEQLVTITQKYGVELLPPAEHAG